MRSNGDVGEFSAFGGAATKRRLLALEGIHLPLQHGLCFEPSVALKHLREVDPRLGVLIDRVGRFHLNPSTSESTFAALLRAIIYQQLAGAAAAAIYRRVLAALPHQHVTAARVAATSDEALRAAGLSRPKLRSIRDLAERALADEVPDTRQLYVQSDDMIVEMLTPIRGIGRWTVEMLLIRLGRPDVLPTSDFGIRRGFGRWFLGGRMPSERHVARRGERWRPYRTAASWYLWRAADANVDLDGD